MCEYFCYNNKLKNHDTILHYFSSAYGDTLFLIKKIKSFSVFFEILYCTRTFLNFHIVPPKLSKCHTKYLY